MTREQYMQNLLKTYHPVHLLADKNECKALRVRHREMKKDLVVHSFAQPVAAYEALYHLQCAHLPLICDVIDLEDGQIILEEFIDGITVREVMESGPYRYAGARKVLRDVCRALSVLHERNLVHRDVKPENVVITPAGRAVLIDFNAARKISAASKDTVVMGTVGYASPEQLGLSQSDARTDIYAMGVLLNVMLTGKHPSEKLAKGKAGRIVRKCTSVSPDKRYQTAEKFAKAL